MRGDWILQDFLQQLDLADEASFFKPFFASFFASFLKSFFPCFFDSKLHQPTVIALCLQAGLVAHAFFWCLSDHFDNLRGLNKGRLWQQLLQFIRVQRLGLSQKERPPRQFIGGLQQLLYESILRQLDAPSMPPNWANTSL